MADTHIYKYPRVLSETPTHIIKVWHLGFGGSGSDDPDAQQPRWHAIDSSNTPSNP